MPNVTLPGLRTSAASVIPLRAGLFLAALALSHAVFAQVPNSGSIERDTRQLQPAAPGITSLPVIRGEGTKRAGSDQTEFYVASFQISGATRPEVGDLHLLLPPGGKKYTLGEIQDVAARITDAYRAHGFFLARAYVPEQQLTGGVLTITIAEGKLQAARFTPNSQLKGVGAGILTSLPTGQALNQFDAERALLLLTDLPGAQVTGTLSAGTEPGTSELDVDAMFPSRVQFLVALDNYGNRYLGSARLTLGVDFHNLTGVGDSLGARITGSNGDGLRYYDINYTRPLLENGLKVIADVSRTEYSLGGSFAGLDATGYADAYDIGLGYSFVRSLTRNVAVEAHYVHKNLVDLIGTADLDTSRSSDEFIVGLNGDMVTGPSSLVAYNASVTGGNLDIASGTAKDSDAASLKTDGGFAKINGSVRLSGASPYDTTYLISASGQYSSKNLDSSEKFALGGPTGVRAYPVGEAPSDQAILISAELRHALALRPDTQTSVFGFLDAAHGEQDASPISGAVNNSRTLTGVGIGLDVLYSRYVTLRAMVAHRLGSERDTAAPDDATRGWLVLSSTF